MEMMKIVPTDDERKNKELVNKYFRTAPPEENKVGLNLKKSSTVH